MPGNFARTILIFLHVVTGCLEPSSFGVPHETTRSLSESHAKYETNVGRTS